MAIIGLVSLYFWEGSRLFPWFCCCSLERETVGQGEREGSQPAPCSSDRFPRSMPSSASLFPPFLQSLSLFLSRSLFLCVSPSLFSEWRSRRQHGGSKLVDPCLIYNPAFRLRFRAVKTLTNGWMAKVS